MPGRLFSNLQLAIELSIDNAIQCSSQQGARHCALQAHGPPSLHWQLASSQPQSTHVQPLPQQAQPTFEVAWPALAFAASAMLLATTHQICREVASIPFLWIVPLALYLLSFIICFDRPGWYQWWIWLPLMTVLAVAAFFLLTLRLQVPLPLQILGFALVMFACCMACHGELERSKPPTVDLTTFYLMISAGGALGSLFVSVVAPRVFVVPVEFELSIIGSIAASLFAFFRLRPLDQKRSNHWSSKWLVIPLAGVAVCLMIAHPLVEQTKNAKARLLHASRNPYGSLRVFEYIDDEGYDYSRSLFNGTIKHGGEQFVSDRRSAPNSYYSKHGGLGVTFRYLSDYRAGEKLKVGIIGLGVGTIAAWSRLGERYIFYELNPDVLPVAQQYFSFLSDDVVAQSVEVVLGDARLQLEEQWQANGSQHFDLLVVDAFASDAIPMHLLTTECFQVYQTHVRPDGAMAFHISNRFIDLGPVTAGLARAFQQHAIQFNDDGDHELSDASRWVILTSDDALAENLRNDELAEPLSADANEVVWTDDFGALQPLMNWGKLWSLFRR